MAYTIKGTPPGYNVNTLIDYLLNFNASWPLLKIEASGSGIITLNGSPQTIHTHNLGYPPFYFIISKDLEPGGGVFDLVSGLGKGIGVNSSNLAYDGSNTSGGTYNFYYYICRLPLNTAYDAPVIVGSTTKTTENDEYVFKVTKPGKSTSSTDMRDYALHSNTRSPMVQKVDFDFATTLVAGYLYRTVTHGLGYTPIAFSFIKWTANTLGYDNDRLYVIAPPIGIAAADYSVDNVNVISRADSTYTSLTVPKFATVILKDPFNKQTVNVSFP